MNTGIDMYRDILNGKVKKFPMGSWNPENDGYRLFVRCFRDLVFNVLRWDRQQMLDKLTINTFIKGKLSGGLHILFEDSPYKAAQRAFPEWGIRPWEMRMTPQNFWTNETIISAVRWLFNEKLELKKREDIIQFSNREMFEKHGFLKPYIAFHKNDMSKRKDKSGVFELLKEAFPEFNFNIWEFRKVSSWTDKDLRDSIIWLIEVKLKWSYEEVVENIKVKHFYENGLSGLITNKFRNSPYLALKFAYPELDWENIRHRMELSY